MTEIEAINIFKWCEVYGGGRYFVVDRNPTASAIKLMKFLEIIKQKIVYMQDMKWITLENLGLIEDEYLVGAT